ncbi:MAG: hypothetical protein WAR79_08045 [Melioribacteraceae bacterium]
MDLIIETQISNKIILNKVTALWAFSEAALGGILHILKIPLTGLFIGSSAVIFISLIAYFSNSRKEIFESTIKVLIVKFIVSPYTPLNAYIAVFIQSLLGYILFFKGFNKLSPILLGILSLLYSAFQKIFVLTIIFGMTLWESIDIFFKFVIDQILPNSINIVQLKISYIIVGIYVCVHLISGILAGFYASNIPQRLQTINVEKNILLNNQLNDFLLNRKSKTKKKKWWKKPSNIGIFIFSIIVIILSYFVKDFDKNIAFNIIIMLFRSVMIIVIWYYLISPVALKFVNKFLMKRKQKQAEEVESIVSVFPIIKSIIKYSWNETQNVKNVKRVFTFLDKILIHYLLLENIIFEKKN